MKQSPASLRFIYGRNPKNKQFYFGIHSRNGKQIDPRQPYNSKQAVLKVYELLVREAYSMDLIETKPKAKQRRNKK